jgi:xanthosine utilization system XapX-like protein
MHEPQNIPAPPAVTIAMCIGVVVSEQVAGNKGDFLRT